MKVFCVDCVAAGLKLGDCYCQEMLCGMFENESKYNLGNSCFIAPVM